MTKQLAHFKSFYKWLLCNSLSYLTSLKVLGIKQMRTLLKLCDPLGVWPRHQCTHNYVFNNVPEKKFLKQPHIQDSIKIRLIPLMGLATQAFFITKKLDIYHKGKVRLELNIPYIMLKYRVKLKLMRIKPSTKANLLGNLIKLFHTLMP